MIRRPLLLLILVLLLGWLHDILFSGKDLGVNFLIFIILSLFLGLFWLFINGLNPAPQSLWFLPLVLFFALMTLVIPQKSLPGVIAYVATLVSLGLFVVTCLGGRWTEYSELDYLVKAFQLAVSITARPIMYIREMRREAAERHRRLAAAQRIAAIRGSAPPEPVTPQEAAAPGLAAPGMAARDLGTQFRQVALGLVIVVPLIAGFTCLMSLADPAFQQALADLPHTITIQVPHLLHVLVWAYVLAGIFLHAGSQSRDEHLVLEHGPLIQPFLSFIESVTVLVGVFLLFAFFVPFQLTHLFDGDKASLPQAALLGIIELGIVACLCLVVMRILRAVTRREEGWHRYVYSVMNAYILGMVIVILVSINSRISQVAVEGFDRWRFYGRGFLIWLGCLSVAFVLLEVFRRERNFALTAVLITIVFASMLCMYRAGIEIAPNLHASTSQANVLESADIGLLPEDNPDLCSRQMLSSGPGDITGAWPRLGLKVERPDLDVI